MLSFLMSTSGVYIKREIHIPPPFLDLYFSPKKIYYIEVVCATGEKFKAFFYNFLNFKSTGEKLCILFTNFGKNMHFPPFFLPPFNHFFPQHDIWPYFGENRQINTPSLLRYPWVVREDWFFLNVQIMLYVNVAGFSVLRVWVFLIGELRVIILQPNSLICSSTNKKNRFFESSL